MADAMLKKTQQNEHATAQERATMDTSHKENVNPSLVKGKGKVPAPKSGSAPNVHRYLGLGFILFYSGFFYFFIFLNF